jgi:hypothetical protein
MDAAFFERVKEFEKYHVRDQAEDRNLDQMLSGIKDEFEQHRISGTFGRVTQCFRNILSISSTYFMKTRCEIISFFPDEANHVISFEHQSGQEKCPTDRQQDRRINDIQGVQEMISISP